MRGADALLTVLVEEYIYHLTAKIFVPLKIRVNEIYSPFLPQLVT